VTSVMKRQMTFKTSSKVCIVEGSSPTLVVKNVQLEEAQFWTGPL